MKPTESNWPADTSAPVLETTVGGVLREAARRAPDKIALVEGAADAGERRRWTYSHLLDEAERCAHALLGRFSPGERIAVWANNIPEWVILEFGAALANITLVTANPAFKANEIEYVLRHSKAAGVFVIPEHRGNPMLKSVERLRPGLPTLREVVSFDDWEEFLEGGSRTRNLPEANADAIAQMQYTSGTTGAPKGALLHHRGITNNARFIASRIEAEQHDVWLSVLPLFHAAGSAVNALGAVQTLGTQILVPDFDPRLVLEIIEAEQTTIAGLVPTMLVGVLDHEDFGERDLSSLAVVWSGGSDSPPDLIRRVEADIGARLTIAYGQTETSPMITMNDTMDDKTGTVGDPLPQNEVRIVDPSTGEVTPVGTPGEICTRGYLVMAGYFEMPEETADTIDADGWLHTGDIASMDERGYVRIEGRIKEMIIRGGENIYPREIEQALSDHPAVSEVAVVGIPDEKWGEQPAAFVCSAAGRTLMEEELDAFVRERFASYKAPRYWVFVEEFPRTPLGKVQKFILRDIFLSSRNA
jgi:fatty-acyl-CoA synthase